MQISHDANPLNEEYHDYIINDTEDVEIPTLPDYSNIYGDQSSC